MSPISSGAFTSALAPSNEPQGLLQKTYAAVRLLNSATDVNKDFSVARDPETQHFVVLVRDRSTGDLIEQIPAEEVLKMSVDLEQGNRIGAELCG
jgi:uncharacterized FlaG/YvyC family protein